MVKLKQNKWSLTTLAIIVLIGLIAMPFTSLIKVANFWFMIGLVFLIGAAFFIIEKGHLFAGWRRRHRKNEDPLPEEKISVRNVASVKNGPIVVNKYARFCLIVSLTLIVLGIVVTL
ncbi:hypothetical protein AYR62_02310 [Secundilactobacillus paracollinoides]|uniref:DUF3899 domain-containing protein n=1 Tax=Secundilactobacillus paracollinoides TaxID=240427 RepID=A0A1B2IUT7_9LACO|nr:DUF3899 domain-containing protein [Secundilactobacillus paracollinoides]ANZ59996.1 hypothetical protein AYR61_00610 [Secundilactobacillus paracollinoides]ANZ63049.1 hypothetical protein AYR62_02310 [Secundilactobacillus paracollinoides]ANZ65788.1 hypothetical protein AYR63_00620 [Secundilactobacillus paracollinoides]KRL76880.1 hypothetical protein FC17_GL001542 [Secundilactobacillus paracollinoides DSM 15502 = JCM 11969]